MQDISKHSNNETGISSGAVSQIGGISLAALNFKGEAPSVRFEEAKIEDITDVTEFVEAELEKLDCPMKTTIQINVAIDEIYSNIANYGYKGGKGPAAVEVIETDEPHAVSLRFTDSGIPYDPLRKEDPDVTLSVEERGIGGLGIFMVKKTMDGLAYKHENGQNIFVITKKL